MGASQNELLVCCVHMFMVSRGAWGIERMDAEPLDHLRAAVTAAGPPPEQQGGLLAAWHVPSAIRLLPAACRLLPAAPSLTLRWSS